MPVPRSASTLSLLKNVRRSPSKASSRKAALTTNSIIDEANTNNFRSRRGVARSRCCRVRANAIEQSRIRRRHDYPKHEHTKPVLSGDQFGSRIITGRKAVRGLWQEWLRDKRRRIYAARETVSPDFACRHQHVAQSIRGVARRPDFVEQCSERRAAENSRGGQPDARAKNVHRAQIGR